MTTNRTVLLAVMFLAVSIAGAQDSVAVVRKALVASKPARQGKGAPGGRIGAFPVAAADFLWRRSKRSIMFLLHQFGFLQPCGASHTMYEFYEKIASGRR